MAENEKEVLLIETANEVETALVTALLEREGTEFRRERWFETGGECLATGPAAGVLHSKSERFYVWARDLERAKALVETEIRLVPGEDVSESETQEETPE